MKKCSNCKCNKDFTEFINEGGKQFKTCNGCRKIKRIENTENTELKTEKTEIRTEQINNENNHSYLLTHQRKWKRFNREFIDRASLPRHKYEMNHVFVDIRD